MKLKNVSLLLALLPALALPMAGQKRHPEDQDGMPKRQAVEQIQPLAIEPVKDAPQVKLSKLFQLFNFLSNFSSAELQKSWDTIVQSTVRGIGCRTKQVLIQQLLAIAKSPKIDDIDENELCRFISELLSQDPTCVYEATKASCQHNNTDIFYSLINMRLFKAAQLLLENNCCFFKNILANLIFCADEQFELYFYQELLKKGASIEALFANEATGSASPYYPATLRYLLTTYQFPQSAKDNILINMCNDEDVSEDVTENACILVEHGANVNISDNDDRTLLMIATKKKLIDMVLTLLAAGADPSQRNQAGENALDFAKARRLSPENLQIQKILRDATLGLHTYQLKKPDPMQQ